MKNRKIQKFLSSIISLSMMASLFVMPNAAAAGNTGGLYANPDIYINDNFAQAQALGTEDRLAEDGTMVTTASGWDVTGGGYTTGKNSGGKFNLVANSTKTAVTMNKAVPNISGGMVRWEFAAKPYEITSGFYGRLYTSNSDILAQIHFSKGTLKYKCAEGVMDIGTYSENSLCHIVSYLDLENNKVAVYLNGDLISDEWDILTNATISRAVIMSHKGLTGTLNVVEFSLIKDYILYEDFGHISFHKRWQAAITALNNLGGGAKLQPGNMAAMDISHGNVTTDDTVEFQYRFKTTELADTKVMDIQAEREYENLLPSGLANCDTAGALGSASTLYSYSIVNDPTAKDGKSAKFYATSDMYRSMLFEFSVPYEQIKNDSRFNLSFDVKKSADLQMKKMDTARTPMDFYMYRMFLYAEYKKADGTTGTTPMLADIYSNVPHFKKSTEWQKSSYTFFLNHNTVATKVNEAAGEGATITAIKATVNGNMSETSFFSAGSAWIDNICFAAVKDSDSAMALNLTSGGKITLTANGTTTNIADYRPNIWQNVRITYDRSTGKAKVRHNHLNEVSNISVNNIVPENLVFTNNSDSATVTVGNITVKKVYDEPSDYVPTPVKPADDGYYASLLSCALWTETGGRGWDAISGFDERTSLMGFYDEGKPEVSDWEIKWMVEHGIDSQIFCWFHEDINNNGGAIPAFKDAKYSDMLDYSLMWTNTGSQYIASAGAGFQSVFRDTYVPYWIDNYFKDNNYTKIDNKPVLYFFSGEIIQYLGGGSVAETLKQLYYLDEKCREAGFDGVKVFAYGSSADLLAYTPTAEDGFENVVAGSFTYGYYERSVNEISKKWSNHTAATNTALPVLGLNHNTEAWNGKFNTYTTPGEFEQIAKKVKEFTDEWNYSNIYTNSTINGKPNQKLLVVDNWNEFGEGHFMMPTKTFGFEYLDAFRRVFSPNAGSHTDVVPTASQRERINKWYDQSRVRRDGANTASSTKKGNFIEYWDFTDPDTATYVSKNSYSLGNGRTLGVVHTDGIKITEGVGIQGVTNNGHDIVRIDGLNLNVDETGADTVYIRSNQNVYFSTVLVRPCSDGSNIWSNGPTFYTDYTDGSIVEQTVYMGDTEDWTGTVTGIYVRVPVTRGDSFTIEAIGIMKSNLFEVGEELVTDGSFEKDANAYSTSGVNTEVSCYEFNRGAESLKVTGNGTVKFDVPGVESNGAYTFESFAKLHFDDETESSYSAYITYNVGGTSKRTNAITQKFGDDGFAKLTGEFEINELNPISDATLCIENTGGNVYYLDDVSLRRFDSNHSSSDSVTGNTHDGIILTFGEDVTVDGATAVCTTTGESLTVTEIPENSGYYTADLAEGQIFGDSIDAWSAKWVNGFVPTLDSEESVDGGTSIKLANPVNAETGAKIPRAWWYTANIDGEKYGIRGGDSLVISGWMKYGEGLEMTENQHNVFGIPSRNGVRYEITYIDPKTGEQVQVIEFWRTENDFNTDNNSSEWQYVSSTVTIPATIPVGASITNIEIEGVFGDGYPYTLDGDIWFDQWKVTRAYNAAKPTKNKVLVSLPTEAVGRNTIVVSGIKTASAGQSVGVIVLDTYSGVDGIVEDYYTTDGNYVEKNEIATLGGKSITGYVQINNNSTTEVSGNLISAFYNGNELLNVVFRPFTAKANYPGEVEFEVEVPEKFTDYKVFVWSDEYEPLLK